MDMDIKQLKYFLTIAEEGQITAAAKKLHMAQPPLSQQLKLLEEELGVKLFDRGLRHVRLTEAGELLRTRAQQIVELSNYTINEIKDYTQGLTGTLSIGMVSSSGSVLLNEIILDFHKQYLGIKFELHEGNTLTILDLLNKGIIEVGVVRTPFKALGTECKYMKSEPMVAVMTKDYCEDNNPELSILDLKNKPLIIYRRFEQLIHEACLEHGFEPNIFSKNDDARTTLAWSNAGLGLGILPMSAFQLGKNDNLIYKKIDYDTLITSLAVIWNKERYLSSLAKKFINYFN